MLPPGPGRRVLLFAPLAAASVVRAADADQLAALCASCDALGLLTTGHLAAEVASAQSSWSDIDYDNLTEFRHCKNTLSLLHGIFPPLFPKPVACQAAPDAERKVLPIRGADLTWMEEGAVRQQPERLFSVRPRVSVCFSLSGSQQYVRTAVLSEKVRSIDARSIVPVMSQLSMRAGQGPDGSVGTKLLKLSLQALVLEDGAAAGAGLQLSAPDSADSNCSMSSAASDFSPDLVQHAWLQDANTLKRKLLRFQDSDGEPYPDIDARAGIPRFSPAHSPRMPPPPPPGRHSFSFDDAEEEEEEEEGRKVDQCSEEPSPFLPSTALLFPSGIQPAPPPPNPVSDIFQLTFLGTGSATPSKYRNSSCVLLTLPQKRGASARAGPPPARSRSRPPVADQHIQVLLDVGEGPGAALRCPFHALVLPL